MIIKIVWPMFIMDSVILDIFFKHNYLKTNDKLRIYTILATMVQNNVFVGSS
jgi:hypothetical protein